MLARRDMQAVALRHLEEIFHREPADRPTLDGDDGDPEVIQTELLRFHTLCYRTAVKQIGMDRGQDDHHYGIRAYGGKFAARFPAVRDSPIKTLRA